MFLIRIPWCFLLHWVTHLCCCPTSPTSTTTTSIYLLTFVFLLWKYPQNKHAHTHIADKILGSHNPPSLLGAQTNKQTPTNQRVKKDFQKEKKTLAKCYHLTQHLLSPSCFQCQLFAIFFFFPSFASISLSHKFWVVDLFGFIMHSCYLLSEILFIYWFFFF